MAAIHHGVIRKLGVPLAAGEFLGPCRDRMQSIDRGADQFGTPEARHAAPGCVAGQKGFQAR
jgi:hypothetical protein